MVEGESGHLVFPSELFSPSVYVYVYLSPCFVSSFCLISFSYLHLYFSTIKSKSLINLYYITTINHTLRVKSSLKYFFFS
jgi:hypothetical protein